MSKALLVVVVVIVATAFGHSSASWCVCKDGLSDTILQKTLDYACGAGADCNPIRPSGACYNPISVRSHCSFAVNSYFQKRTQATGSCDFGGTAALTLSNPSTNGCTFPASASGSGTTGTTPSISVPSTTPTTTTPTTSPVSTTTPVTGGSPTVSGTPTTSSPYTTTVQPSTGTPTTTTSPTTSSYPNGLSTGIAPTGASMNGSSRGLTVGLLHSAFYSVLVASLMLLLLSN